MTIKSSFDIFKIGKRVFQIGNINYDLQKINKIVETLDLGFKFVPCIHNNILDIFNSLLSNFDKNISKFNSSIFFAKNKILKNTIQTDNSVKNPDIDIDTESCLDFSCISKRLNSIKDKKFFLQNECIDLRYKYYQELSNIKFTFKPNLNISQIISIKDFIYNKPFKVIQCDKNIGAAIISNDLHNELCLSHLMNNNIYAKLDNNPLESTVQLIEDTIMNLAINKQLSLSLAKKLTNGEKNLGKFRVLAKLHKDKFNIRPIINSVNHPTSKLCLLIDLILQPVVQLTDSYIKDSQQLLQKCEYLRINYKKVYIYSCDFDSLYTNIQKNDAVNRITDYIKDKLDFNYITPLAFSKILSLIFDHNVFAFKNLFFVQTSGLAMGCICGPSVANMFIYILEKNWISLNKPMVYSRFIDDILIILDKELNESDFLKQFLNLKLNIVHSEEVNFLDLNISFDPLTCKLNFSLYIKPTNTFQYLLSFSNHPKFIFDNIPKSLFLRIRRICSSYTDYLYFSRKLIFQLLERGFNFKKLISTSFSIGKIERNSLLAYKNKKIMIDSTKKYNIWLNNLYSYSHNNNDTIIKNSFKSLIFNYKWLSNIKLNICNSISENLLSIFVFNNTNNFIKKNFYTTPCNTKNCEACPLISKNSFYFLKNFFVLPLKDNCNCLSRNVVYIIKCELCNVFYIGQSGNSIKLRISQHLKTIKYFQPFINYTSEIGYHFNLRGHSINDHFRFSVFRSNLDNDKIRFSIESDIINIFHYFHPPVLNAKIPKISKIEHLSFN